MPHLQQNAAVQMDTLLAFCQVASVKTNAAFCSSAALLLPLPSWFLCSVQSLFCSHSVCYKWLGVGVSREGLISIPSEDSSRQGTAARLSSPSWGTLCCRVSVTWESWFGLGNTWVWVVSLLDTCTDLTVLVGKQQDEFKADQAVRDQDTSGLGTAGLGLGQQLQDCTVGDGKAPFFGNLPALFFSWFGWVLTHPIKQHKPFVS